MTPKSSVDQRVRPERKTGYRERRGALRVELRVAAGEQRGDGGDVRGVDDRGAGGDGLRGVHLSDHGGLRTD